MCVSRAGRVCACACACTGYVRIACMVASFYYAQTDFKLAFTLYLLNFAGDVVDGFFARLLSQCAWVDACVSAGGGLERGAV